MGQITNVSRNSTVEVFGQHNGVPVHFLLPPGRQTTSDVDCQAIRGADGVRIFDESNWWRVFTSEIFVYDFEDSLFDDWFVSDLSLHCIPFRSGAGSPPWDRGYAAVDDAFVTVALDESLSLDQPPTHVPDPFSEREIDSANFLFGRFVRTKNFISVRLDAIRGEQDSDAMLPKLRDWKRAIEVAWNGSGVPSPTGAPKLVFECDWLNTTDGTEATAAGHGEDHYSVFIGAIKERESLFTWNQFTDNRTAIHEFGHYLGLDDGYVRDGELPWLRRAVAEGQIPISDTKLRDALLKGHKPLYPWIVAQGLWNKERVEQRVQNYRAQHPGINTCCASPDVMASPSTSTIFSQCMMDAIHRTVHKDKRVEHVTQPLCWQEGLIKRKF